MNVDQLAPIWRLEDVERQRGGGDRAFRLIVPNLQVNLGDRVAIVGPSGSGKSTLLDLLALALAPDKRRRFEFYHEDTFTDVMSLWKPVQPNDLCALRRRYVGYVLQTGGLLPFLSARDNITLPASRNETVMDNARLEHVTDSLSLDSRILTAKPSRLSLGERQRVAIARALMHRPRLVLADEPTASLDPLNADKTMKLFCNLVDDEGIACVVVTHNQSMAEEHGFSIMALKTEGDASGRPFSTLVEDPGVQP